MWMDRIHCIQCSQESVEMQHPPELVQTKCKKCTKICIDIRKLLAFWVYNLNF